MITLFYLSALIWVDAKQHVFSGMLSVWSILPMTIMLTMLSHLIRFARWQWLLVRAGHSPAPAKSFLAYLAGFAFTATPGKVGELIRIRYLSPMGITPARTLSAFVYERAFDLFAVLFLAVLCVNQFDVFLFAIVFGFVLLCLATIIAVSLNPYPLNRLIAYLRIINTKRLSKLIQTLRDGLVGCRLWANPLDVFVSFFLGISAWSLCALSFVYLLNQLQLDIPFFISISIYPIALLAGAASLMPGGIGSTEATLIGVLSANDISIDMAVLAAIGIRLSTLWFSIIIGLLAVIIFEWPYRQIGQKPPQTCTLKPNAIELTKPFS
ncbi:MAG: lysylphosphatidylglycerol synthase transmembrane domain-containing protein [Gammaproteobacteria bacterium]